MQQAFACAGKVLKFGDDDNDRKRKQEEGSGGEVWDGLGEFVKFLRAKPCRIIMRLRHKIISRPDMCEI